MIAGVAKPAFQELPFSRPVSTEERAARLKHRGAILQLGKPRSPGGPARAKLVRSRPYRHPAASMGAGAGSSRCSTPDCWWWSMTAHRRLAPSRPRAVGWISKSSLLCRPMKLPPLSLSATPSKRREFLSPIPNWRRAKAYEGGGVESVVARALVPAASALVPTLSSPKT